MVAVGFVVLLAALSPASAVEPDEVLANAALEARARQLSAGLRCFVCQNQSIDESNAPLARDLRRVVRERLVAGDSDGQVMDFIVARYGEYALLKPTFGRHTIVLWLLPGALLAGLGAYFVLRARSATTDAPAPLTRDEQARLDAVLGADAAPPRSEKPTGKAG